MSDTQPTEQNRSTERSLAGETGSVSLALSQAIEIMAFRLLEKKCYPLMWEQAPETLREKYRREARRFCEAVRELHSPNKVDMPSGNP